MDDGNGPQLLFVDRQHFILDVNIALQYSFRGISSTVYLQNILDPFIIFCLQIATTCFASKVTKTGQESPSCRPQDSTLFYLPLNQIPRWHRKSFLHEHHISPVVAL